MQFKDKTIIIVSQQDWGQMFISKHHYAVELAKRGNKVFFLNSPDKTGSLSPGQIIVEQSDFEGVSVVKHRLGYPYIIKHKAKWLHDFLLKSHIRRIIAAVGKVDVVWSFDYSNTLPLKSFPQAYKIFMPVDEPKGKESLSGAEGADVIISVTNEILSRYSKYRIPKFFVNHGVSDDFLIRHEATPHKRIQVGLSGNFLRIDIDWPTIEKIITGNKDVDFNFWGPFSFEQANVADGGLAERSHYLEKIAGLDNVILHGVVSSKILSENLHAMDAFLICYDIEKDHSGGTNYHKVLEYLATGKVIVSNNVSTYAKQPDLITMPEERNNKKLPELFKKVCGDLAYYNKEETQQLRYEYAKSHTYANNIIRIEEFINSN